MYVCIHVTKSKSIQSHSKQLNYLPRYVDNEYPLLISIYFLEWNSENFHIHHTTYTTYTTYTYKESKPHPR